MAVRTRGLRHAGTLGLAILFLAIAGCQDADIGKSVVVESGLPVARSYTTGAASKAVAPSAPSTAPALPSDTQHRDEAQAAFQYPFPQREDLFLLPSKKPPARQTAPEEEHDVKLMGFANVGGLRALVRIDGIVAPLQVGESRGEIRVLAIDPPKITLQRGPQRWTESLFGTP